jgi:O-antigen/teichoic acid export membrane protein
MKLRSILTNFASLASLRFGLAGLTFALFWLLSHRLNAAQLGGFSLLMNVFFMVQTLPLLGMGMPLVRRIAANPRDAASETSNAFFFALPIAAVIGIGLIFWGHSYADQGLSWPFGLLGLSMLPTAWTAVAEGVLVGQEQMHWFAYVNLLEALGRLVGAWVVVNLGYGLIGIFVVFVCFRLAASLAYVLNSHLPPPQWRLVHAAQMKPYRQEAPTYLSIVVITALCTRLDILLVARMLSLTDAGIYAAAARLSDAALMMPTMVAMVIFPAQTRLFESDRAAYSRFLEGAIRWCLIAGFAVSLAVVAVAPFLVHLIYAPRLAPAAPILQILILGTTVMVIDQVVSTTMIAARAQNADLRSMSIGLIVLVSLFLVFTRIFGLTGAAIAAPTALLLRVSYRLYWAQKLFARPLLWLAFRPLLAAAMAVSILFLRLTGSILTDLALAMLSYGFILWVIRALQYDDLVALRQLIVRRRGMGT